VSKLEDVPKNRLQLVGVASMWIAAKYEEMYAPEVVDFVYITDNAYTKSEIREMECRILKALGFELGRPLPLHFLRRNSKAGEVCILMVLLIIINTILLMSFMCLLARFLTNWVFT